MTKKIILTFIITIFALFVTTYSFATDEIKEDTMNAANGIRNTVGDIENTVENTVKDAGNAVREGTNDLENAGNDVTSGMNNNLSTSTSTNNQESNNGYSASRTSTGSETGINSTMLTWLILAIVAVAIIALIWFYATQNNHSKYDN